LFLTHFAINKKHTTIVYGVFFWPAMKYDSRAIEIGS